MISDSLLPFTFPAVGRKKVTAAFDGGRLTSNGGVLLLAQAERQLALAERLAACIADSRDPARVIHRLDDMLRARMLAIACGYEDADNPDHLRHDPGFKLALGKLPESATGLCSQPTMSRWENAPSPREIARAMAAMVDLYCRSGSGCSVSDQLARIARTRRRISASVGRLAGRSTAVTNRRRRQHHDRLEPIGVVMGIEQAQLPDGSGRPAAMCERFARLVRPGGTLVAAFLAKSTGYRVATQDYPAVSVTAPDLEHLFSRFAAAISVTAIGLTAAEVRSGYSGLYFLEAQAR